MMQTGFVEFQPGTVVMISGTLHGVVFHFLSLKRSHWTKPPGGTPTVGSGLARLVAAMQDGRRPRCAATKAAPNVGLVHGA